MKQKLLMFLVFGVLIAIMIGLNAVSYVQRTSLPDSEDRPNRSSYNPGSTGTLALYSLLAESGHPVSRWQRPPSALTSSADSPATLAIVGTPRREITKDTANELLNWVATGGRLIIIDREPHADLLVSGTAYELSVRQPSLGTLSAISTVDPASQPQMTSETSAVRPLQPTPLMTGVGAVQPSRFASSFGAEYSGEIDWKMLYSTYAADTQAEETEKDLGDTGTDDSGEGEYYTAPMVPEAKETPIEFYLGFRMQEPPPPPPVTRSEPMPETRPGDDLAGPIFHLGSSDRVILAEMPYGTGTIVYLTDPFIVSNGGISMADNVRLAVNVLTAGGPVAFDEYHQGYGSGTNRIIEYFDGTPVTAIILQLIAIGALVIFTRSRRFARPLPGGGADRLSKLEYVDAMAELQLRTRAYDLALENIYTDFRRRASRFLGVDNMTTPRRDLARLIAERTGRNASDVEQIMAESEDLIHGSSARKSDVIRLARAIRELESALGIPRTARSRF